MSSDISLPHSTITRLPTITETLRHEVEDLSKIAEDVDGASPLSEQTLRAIREGSSSEGTHILIHRDGSADIKLMGYAYVDDRSSRQISHADIVVHPLYRHASVGKALLSTVISIAHQDSARTHVRLWAHGDHPSASALAISMGFERERVLIRMRRSLQAALPQPRFPENIRPRAFQLGKDDMSWLALNAECFADLPDQGLLTLDDLYARVVQPWFDPEGFVLAECHHDNRLVGFYWTKIHRSIENSPSVSDRDSLGEIYVLGVAPAASGAGLGTALTLSALHHLRNHGLRRAMLYVDQTNTAALSLYTRLGFASWSTDILFARSLRLPIEKNSLYRHSRMP